MPRFVIPLIRIQDFDSGMEEAVDAAALLAEAQEDSRPPSLADDAEWMTKSQFDQVSKGSRREGEGDRKKNRYLRNFCGHVTLLMNFGVNYVQYILLATDIDIVLFKLKHFALLLCDSSNGCSVMTGNSRNSV